MLNGIFVALIVIAVAWGAWAGRMAEVNQAAIDASIEAIQLVWKLLGMMALWLGFMRVLRDAGLVRAIARGLAPVMRRLFPDVPADHPAMGAMILNMAANMMGLGNAATPFGLKAMQELDRLNPRKGVATDSMALFLAINTSGVAVLPLGVMAWRAGLGAENVGGIIVPSLLATACSTVAGVLVAKTLARRRRFAAERFEAEPAEASEGLLSGIPGLTDAEASVESAPAPTSSRGRAAVSLALATVILWGVAFHWSTRAGEVGALEAVRELFQSWLLPLLMTAIVLFGFSRRVKVYESLVTGAREGFKIAVMIIPFLVAILVAVGMLRASGALDALTDWIAPFTAAVGFPAEALPMALLRPLSASGAMGIAVETMETFGPDSFVGFLVSVMNGSTETTFYVLVLYYGSVRVRAMRHTLPACLAADATGVAAALFFSRVFF